MFQLESLAQSFPAVEWHAAAAGRAVPGRAAEAKQPGLRELEGRWAAAARAAPAAAQPMIR